jgi:acetate kinase
MTILIINAGSSSVKFSVYSASGKELILHKTIGRLNDITQGIRKIPVMLKENNINLIAKIGHRIVHGGSEFIQPILITPDVFKKLKELEPLAPLHQPYNLKAVEIFAELMPQVPQIACFDTAFHATEPKINKILPLPHKFYDEGVMRYGFHGLSYQYIASVLPEYCGEKAKGKVIVAHLGHGSSMCAMQSLQSVANSMGFSTLDGLMMGTRSGSIDPGVLLYLMEEKGYSEKDLERLLYKESGLLGVAGIDSSDMRDIITSKSENAKLAYEMFCQSAAKNLAALAVCLGGVDVVVFTAGIGENSKTSA